MYKTARGYALIAIILSSALFHRSRAWMGGTGPPPEASNENGKVAASELSSSERDTGKCYPFEAVLRHHGMAETPSSGQGHPASGGLACDTPALTRAFGSASAAVAAPSSSTAVATVSASAPATVPVPEAGADVRPPRVFDGKILIVTVPDPLETSDALEFDRAIAALQEAGATAGYYFELMVTPWLISDLEEPKDVKEGREAQHFRRAFGDEPGAMLFRCNVNCRKDTQLLLLLVPESPAYGLNMHAAREALSAYSTLMKDQGQDPFGPVRWIGPEYSASAESLHQLQYERPPQFLPQPSLQSAYKFCFLSGSVTTREAVVQIKRANYGCPYSMSAPTLSALDLDSLDFLLSQPAFSRDNGSIAILEEDETAYGSSLPLGDTSQENAGRRSLKRNHNRIREFTFPRGVAHVRGLYGNLLRDATAAASAREGSGLEGPTMDFSDALQQPLDTGEEFAVQSPFRTRAF